MRRSVPTFVFVIALAVAAGVAAGIGAYVLQQRDAGYSATDISGVPWGRDFDLTDHDGQRRRLADFRGKAVLMFFGYTNCPDACPTALAELAQVVKRLGSDGRSVQVLFITTDPARDTQERLKTYLAAFDPFFMGLRGTPQEIAAIAKEFKVHFEPQMPAEHRHAGRDAGMPAYMVNHSTGVLALDPAGRPRLYAGPNGRSVESMVRDVQRLLQSS